MTFDILWYQQNGSKPNTMEHQFAAAYIQLGNIDYKLSCPKKLRAEVLVVSWQHPLLPSLVR